MSKCNKYKEERKYTTFDESLNWLDCEYYKRMYDIHGEPSIWINLQLLIEQPKID
jgi:hypothetical protein